MRFRNPFDAPPPLARAPMPHEAGGIHLDTPPGEQPFDPDKPPDGHARGETLPIHFSGDKTEYFRLWVVCQFFTVVTLGLYAPWAKVRKTKYLANHTEIKGRTFDVSLNPVAILKGRLVAFSGLAVGTVLYLQFPLVRPALVLAAFGALAWLLSRSMAFRWWRTSFNGLPFGFTPSVKGLLKPAVFVGVFYALAAIPSKLFSEKAGIWWTLATQLLVMVALGALPYLTTALLHNRLSRANYGRHVFKLDANAWTLFKNLFMRGVGSSLGVWFILGVFLNFVGSMLILIFQFHDLGLLVATVGVLIVTVGATSLARTQRLNYMLNRLSIGESLRIYSTLNSGENARRTMRWALLCFFTFGLAIPFMVIDMWKWRLSHITLNFERGFDDFLVAGPAQHFRASSALADEAAQHFDIEISL